MLNFEDLQVGHATLMEAEGLTQYSPRIEKLFKTAEVVYGVH
jgi:hypothetical protein